jgi:general secretion pathway protein F
MAKLDIAEKRVPQDGRIALRVAGREVDIRVSTMPSSSGERVVLRLLDKQAGAIRLESLGMAGQDLKVLRKLIYRPYGILLVTGPTGSGKSTTLYASLQEINDRSRNILTVEDPIEYNLPGIGQTQVNTKVDMTFARGLRAILRQDPDVVMIGEIRDLETAEIAVQASLTGHLVLSTLHTNTAVGAITRLMDMGIEPAAEKQTRSNPLSSRGSLAAADLALVTRQLATLIQSGIPIEQALSAAAQQSPKPRIRSMLIAIRAKVMEGYTLADSLGEFPRAFPRLYRSTVAAGEHAGHLDLVLNRLADYTENRQEARQKIQLAAIYPIILSIVAIAIVVFLLTYVVPDIIDVFLKQGQELPTLTMAMLAVSEFLADYGVYLFILLVAALMVFRFFLTKPGFRLRFHKRLLHLPLFSGMVRGVNTARYASTLSILTTSGVPLVEAMRIAGEVLSNDFLRQELRDAARKVSEGGSLHRSLDQTGYFPPMMLHMIASGEASGELDSMLERTARMQENTLQSKIAAIVGLFEPMMLLVMGVVVLIIVLAIMLPILNMSNLVG